jgi:hypothetical protein
MRSRPTALLLVALLLLVHANHQPGMPGNLGAELPEAPDIARSSGLTLSSSSLPSAGDTVTGQLTLLITVSGTGTVEWMRMDLVGDSTTTMVNTTSSPWYTSFNTKSVNNGTYTVLVTAFDSDANATVTLESGSFDIANQEPIITAFTVLNAASGNGTSSSDRLWFNVAATGTLAFRWGASDDDLDRATLANVPGSGTPATDGPGTLAYGWDWAPGDLGEGTWNAVLTVSDESGYNVQDTVFIGIDRTGPSLNNVLIGSSGGWQSTSSVQLSGLINNADDGFGSGVASASWSLDNSTWTSTTEDAITLEFSEGEHTVYLRSTDRAGNDGEVVEVAVAVDLTAPEGLGWTLPELTTSRTGAIAVTFAAEDDGAGIDESSSYMEYGFDANGVGATPDLTGRWVSLGTGGLNGSLGLASWATKSGQYLMVRAVVTDAAGNAMTTAPSSFQILPGLDLRWNASGTVIDRLVVKPTQAEGLVHITSTLETNEAYFGGPVKLRLETAPADRLSNVDWTVLETRTVDSADLNDAMEVIEWNLTVTTQGQLDIRVVIDPFDGIDEYNEANNAAYFVVTGASISPGLVPSFAPSLGLVLLAGLLVGVLGRRPRD